MLRGLEQLRAARKILVEIDEQDLDRHQLYEVARLYWSAAIDYDLWPVHLQQAADALHQLLFAHGPISTTIDAMSDAELQTLRRAFYEFIDTAESCADTDD